MEKTSPPSRQSPRGPYGGVDRSEKEHRDLVALNFLLDMLFTDAKKSFIGGYFHFFGAETEIIVPNIVVNTETSRGRNIITFFFKCAHTQRQTHTYTLLQSSPLMQSDRLSER